MSQMIPQNIITCMLFLACCLLEDMQQQVQMVILICIRWFTLVHLCAVLEHWVVWLLKALQELAMP